MSSRACLRLPAFAGALAFAVSAAACSETPGARNQAGAQTTRAERELSTTTTDVLPPGSGDAGSGRPSTAPKAGPGVGRVPSPLKGSAAVAGGASVRRELTYMLQRDDEVFSRGPVYFDAVQEATDAEIGMTWRMGMNEDREVRRLSVDDSEITGQFMPADAVEWSECDWSPPAVYVPKLRVGARVAFETACTMHAGTEGEYRDEMTGEVKVVGTREVRIDGKQFKVWEIERHWRSVATGGPNDEGEGRVTTLWSPELQLVVEHQGHAKKITKGTAGTLELRTKMWLRGFSHGIFP